jgi:pSer/pThr/pTyr-binding forkhead associated (FHA) protein
MKANITLTVTDGALRGTQFPLEDRDAFLIGRGYDCDVRIPCDEEFQTVSRHHCLLGVAANSVWLRDLGSRNGTFLNGKQIGKPEFWALPDEPLIRSCADHELKNGDEFMLGSVVFRVGLPAPLNEVSTPATNREPARELCGCE